jgi:nitroalkane oxidase
MAIDFTLSSAQQRLQRNAREFALEILQPLVKAADEEPDTQKAFQSLKGAYIECHKLGFAMGFLPKQYGGGGVSNVDLQIVAEEITAVDPAPKIRSANGSVRPRAIREANSSPGGR